MKSQVSLELTQVIVLSEAPFKVIPPPSAVVSEGELTLPRTMFLSSTSKLVVLIVDVVPLTVKSPPTTTLPVVVTAGTETKPVLGL